MKKTTFVILLLAAVVLPCVQARDDTSKAFRNRWELPKPDAEHKERSGPITDKGDMRRTRGPEGSVWTWIVELLTPVHPK